ncbi:hypothetical protein PACTADRAFT_5123 [Pachysolen tannophilus NRRL Y-2460]|uniref:DCUN1 domain-containing protein n=1 Tax=Pachysolen tannophilus NRRL Y-2460 TaxID=669874 RepID=A0A1E4TNJ1_PACTA|nr:hypothetical protein PACTADRAFT_5123 [Pachysolen tannophilus NRRL Y-2460]
MVTIKSKFIEITDADPKIATKILSSNDWDLNVSVDYYYSIHKGKTLEDNKYFEDLEEIFNQYKENDEQIGIDGTFKYIQDLGFEPENAVVLALAEFLESPTTGVFLKKKFINNWSNANINSIPKMRKKLLEFQDLMFNDPKFLRKIYDFAFTYSLEENQRSLPPDVAVEYWRLLLTKTFGQEKIETFIKFIENEHNFAISRDQWQMLYLFMQYWEEHPNLETYDESAAWPSLMDQFVEYCKDSHLSYQRYEQERSFGVLSSNSNILCLGSALGSKAKGCRAITAGLEEILIWDIKAGELLDKLRDGIAPGAANSITSAPPSEITYLQYHDLTNILAVGYRDGVIKIWDLASNSVLINFTGHKSSITILKFDRTGTRLCSGSKDSTIMLWDLVGEVGLFKLKSHKDQITGLQFLSEDDMASDDELEDWLLSTSKDGLIKLWDLKSQQCVETHVAHSGECWSLGIYEKQFCITSGIENQLKFWKIDLNQDTTKIIEIGIFEKQSKSRCIDISFKKLNDKLLFFYTQNSDKTIEIFRIRTEDEIKKAKLKREKRLKEKGYDDLEIEESFKNSEINMTVTSFTIIRCPAKVKSCQWSLLSNLKNLEILISLNNNSIEYYRVSLPESIKKLSSNSDSIQPLKQYSIELQGHRTDVRSIDLSDDNKLLATSSNGLLKIWNIKLTNCIRTFECGYALTCKFLPGGTLVVIGTRNGEIELYDLASSTLLESVSEAHGGAIWSLDISNDGKSLVTGSADKTVKFWDFKIENELVPGTERLIPKMKLFHSKTLELNDDILSIRISPDSKLLAVSLLDNTVKVFFFDSLKFFLSLYGHKLPVLSIDISFDSKLIITSSADKNIKIWGLDFGDCHKSIFGHQDSIMNVKFIPNSHNFFSAGKDGLIKYWDGDKFECIQKLAAHQSEVWSLAVSSDGEFLVSSSHDHSIRVWAITDDQVFIEEEREKEMDEQYESTLLASLEGEGDEQPIAKTTGTEEGGEEVIDDEATRIHKQTMESLKAGEKLIEALDIASANEPNSNPILRALNLTADEYLLQTILKIRAAQLEDALLVLPFSYSLNLLKFIQIWTNNENISHNIINLQLFCKVLFFIIRTNFKELASQRNDDLKKQIINLKKQLRSQLQENVDSLGFNLVGLKFLRNQWNLNHNTEFVDEYDQRDFEAKKAKKRLYETVV